jgi:hypothetical protein
MTKPEQSFRGLMNREIREKYWTPLEGRHKTGAWEALDAGYTESHRAYHTWDHVAGLLEKLSEFSDLSTRSDIIAGWPSMSGLRSPDRAASEMPGSP